MKLIIFNRTKYLESIKKLKIRKAPDYVIEAYNRGYIDVVNEYYKLKLENKRNSKTNSKSGILEEYKDSQIDIVKEALTKRDEEFLKAFFVMTNLDIVTGKRIPRKAGGKLKPSGLTNIGFKDVFRKLR